MYKPMKVQKYFNIPFAKKSELKDLFEKVDYKINKMLKMIQLNSEFITPQFIDFYMEIACGNARFKSFYEKEDNNRKNYKSKMRGGLAKDDRNFLLNNFHLLQSLKNKKKDILDCDFNRVVRHTVIDNFLSIANLYVEYSDKVLKKDYSYFGRLDELEEKIKANNSGLYGLVRMLNFEYKDFIELREKIITPYLRYVYSISNSISKTNQQKEENFQSGVLGLLHSVLMYSPEVHNSNFGNYTKYWIRQAMMDNIYRSNIISIPNYNWQQYNTLEKLRSKTKNLEDLSKRSNLSSDKIDVVYSRVLLSQVQSLDELLENNPDNENILMYMTEDKSIDDRLFSSLNKSERFLIGLMFDQFNLIENTITNEDYTKEIKRQSQSVN